MKGKWSIIGQKKQLHVVSSIDTFVISVRFDVLREGTVDQARKSVNDYESCTGGNSGCIWLAKESDEVCECRREVMNKAACSTRCIKRRRCPFGRV